MKRLDDAVTAVVKRWWSPEWTSTEGKVHTGDLIMELQNAINEFKTMHAEQQDANKYESR